MNLSKLKFKHVCYASVLFGTGYFTFRVSIFIFFLFEHINSYYL